MDNTQKLSLKASLKQFGLQVITQRIEAARQQVNLAQESANNEEKSSAGDKYETGRAMGHLQKDMFARQQAENAREYAALQQVRTDSLCSSVMPGAFIRCSPLSSDRTSIGAEDTGFFIAAGLGRQSIDGQTILFLSPAAPLSNALKNKKTGDTITFNGQSLLIEDIF